MNRHAEQLMDATKFLSDDVRVICFCCGNEAFESSGRCGYCHVPLDVSQSANAHGTKPSFIPVLGASGAGKTVYIGLLLDMLSKGTHGLVGLANNSFSLTVQQQTVAALEKRRFPEKTVLEAEDWHWVHCEVAVDKKAKRFADMVTPDLAGESLAMELDSPGSFPSVRTCVMNAEATIVLIDAMRARDHSSEEDLFATKLAAYMRQFAAASGLGRKKVRIPMAVTFTKCDLCPEVLADPVYFAKNNLPSLIQFCDRNFTQVKYFATSAVGSVATVVHGSGHWQIPLHVQPQGITAPLEWAIKGLS